MLAKSLLKYVVLLLPALLQPIRAFWWAPTAAPTTTESPALTLKQIPITYFRTYTYQPLPGNPLAAFPFYHQVASALPAHLQPLLSSAAGTARYDQSAAAYMHPMSMALTQQQDLQQQQHRQHLSHYYQLAQPPVLHLRPSIQRPFAAAATTSTTTTTRRPTTTRTTPTTTTTTPPPPPTTTTTTPRTTTTSTANEFANKRFSLYGAGGSAGSGGSEVVRADGGQRDQPYAPYPYPTFDRRAYMGYNKHFYRAAYPYPDYTALKSAAPKTTQFNGRVGQIQYAPCMCPIRVSASTVERNVALSLEGRTTDGGGEDGGGDSDVDDIGSLPALERSEDMNLPDEASKIGKKTVGNEEQMADYKGETKIVAVRDQQNAVEAAHKIVSAPIEEQHLRTNKIEGGEAVLRATRETEKAESNEKGADAVVV